MSEPLLDRVERTSVNAAPHQLRCVRHNKRQCGSRAITGNHAKSHERIEKHKIPDFAGTTCAEKLLNIALGFASQTLKGAALGDEMC